MYKLLQKLRCILLNRLVIFMMLSSVERVLYKWYYRVIQLWFNRMRKYKNYIWLCLKRVIKCNGWSQGFIDYAQPQQKIKFCNDDKNLNLQFPNVSCTKKQKRGSLFIINVIVSKRTCINDYKLQKVSASDLSIVEKSFCRPTLIC